MSDVLERVRMCVAEAGYDPKHVNLSGKGEVQVVMHDFDGALGVPTVVTWRAFGLVSTDESLPCLSCYESGDCDPCLADRRLVLDCGRER